MKTDPLREHLAKIGAKGGKATGASKARTSAQARASVQKRWAKYRAAKKAKKSVN